MQPNSLVFKSLLIIGLIIGVNFYSFGNSFQSLLATKNIDEKCNLSEQLIEKYLESNIDSVKVIGEHLLIASNKAQNKLGINLSYYYLGNYLIRVSREQDGMELLRKARNYFLGIEDYNKVTEISNEMGNGYNYLRNFEEACKWYEQSLKYGKLATEENLCNVSMINLAQALLSRKKFDEAKKYAEDYRDWVLKLGALKSCANAYAVLGDIELQQANFNSAIYYFDQCYRFSQRCGDVLGKSHAYTNIGIVKFLEGELEESEQFFKDAIDLRLKLSNVALICESYLNYGGIKFERKDFAGAIAQYKVGLKIAEKNKRYTDAIEFLEALKEAYTIYDVEELDGVNLQIAELEVKKKSFDENFIPFSKLLSKELKASERIRKSGLINMGNQFPFYIGAVALFFGFIFLAIRRKGVR